MSHDDHHEAAQHHEPAGYGVYFITWFALVFLTAITVTAAGLHLGRTSVAVALTIATIKASITVECRYIELSACGIVTFPER